MRFASVYRQFRSVSDFVATLEGLGDSRGRPGGRKSDQLAVVG